MNREGPFIAVDWGTSRMRAMLCDADRPAPHAAGIAFGHGIAQLNKSIPETLFDAIAPWIEKYGKLDIVMAGMVGSNIGWHTVPYMECPASLSELADHGFAFEHGGHAITILPGVSCKNAMGQPDVMRGEELQIHGWAAQNPDHAGDTLLCLPGTHAKWANLEDGTLEAFTTSLVGEMYALLQKHSLLLPRDVDWATQQFDTASFLAGVELVRTHPTAFLHSLFSTRSHAILETGVFSDAASYLSGLLIGADCKAALDMYTSGQTCVEFVGDQALCEKYASAVQHLGHSSRISDGVSTIYSGFLAL